MRIRKYRSGDELVLQDIQRQAYLADHINAPDDGNIEQILTHLEQGEQREVFVITDDDDEISVWGQAGTLEGFEGMIAGFTVVQLYRDEQAYHFVCEGAVHPAYRRQGAGWALLICGLNNARIRATEFESQAELANMPVYFEAWLPANDAASERLAAKCEMLGVDTAGLEGMRLYRRNLY